MPEQLDIMRAIARGLDEIDQRQLGVTKPEWTEAVLTKLCEVGRNEFGCKAGADPKFVPEENRDYGEWLYDLTWITYNNDQDDHLIDVPLVAECEWSDPHQFNAVKDDFHKLLLARAGVRLMIYSYNALMRGWIHGEEPGKRTRREQAAQNVAERLAESVRRFRYRHEDEAWLLAGGVWHADDWCRYFTINRNGAVVPFNP